MRINLSVLVVLAMMSNLALAEDSQQDLSVESFQVKVKPNSFIPVGQVYSDDPSKIKYNRSRSEIYDYEVEVRGRCPSTIAKLGAFRLSINGQTILDIPVSGNNRSLTGNNGNQWEAHTIRVDFREDYSRLIDACNLEAVGLLQDQSHDQVFNSNFIAGQFFSGQRVQVYYHCTGGAGFNDIIYDTTDLPIKALCEATGYQSKLRVTESQLSLLPITGQDGTCKLGITGEFRTNYELYTLRSNNSQAQLQYRFKYQAGSTIAYSRWWERTANPINGGMFVFDYTDRLPTTIDGGNIFLEVDIDGETYTSEAESFSIDCVDALPLQQTQTLDLDLSVSADKTETIAIGGQLCPTHAILTGHINAGYPVNGNMLIMGSALSDLYVMPINLSADQSATQQKRIKLTWPSASNTLSLNGGTPSNALKTQTLNYGLRITNSDSEVIKSIPKQPYVISCGYPSVSPGLLGSSTLGALPDHTGGGGAPTSLKGNSPFSRENDNRTPVINTGLRPDGELVPDKKPLQLLRHELSHVRQQQGRVLTDSDFNEATNQQSSNLSRTVPLENATIASVRSNQTGSRHSTKATLLRGNVGDRCKQNGLPKNTVINQSGQQRVVECVKGKVVINRTKKVQPPWKVGDPVLFLPDIKEQAPKNEER
ncbi:MAG: hypothetical protein L3J84_07370 [Gammaproteobacteria bacterium]|nr:hypothetical protein [Gammaproteobacteria bacterium]